MSMLGGVRGGDREESPYSISSSSEVMVISQWLHTRMFSPRPSFSLKKPGIHSGEGEQTTELNLP